MILSQSPAFYAAQRPAKAGTIRSQKPACYAALRLAKAGMILSQNPAFYAAQRPAKAEVQDMRETCWLRGPVAPDEQKE